LKLLDEGYDVNKLHLVGHSLGGQCIGLVSRHLKALSDNRHIIPRLFALDPAAPGFESGNFFSQIYNLITFQSVEFSMISPDDAKYVQIIHTNAGKYGIEASRGHVDFFPNSGEHQSGCDLEFQDDVCSHRRAWHYYQASEEKNLITFSNLFFFDSQSGKR
jgi:pimeloyl-ACP methyl ester carboxylesterase